MHHPARKTDPVSSHEAADHVVGSGLAKAQQDQAEAAVYAHPGRTSLELSTMCALDRYTLARRLPELEDAGRVHRGPIRQCDISKRKAMEWHPGPKPTPAAPLRQPTRTQKEPQP